MGMVVDVIFAIAEIAVTTGTVPKLQSRMGNIRATAHTAAMGICGRILFRPHGNGISGRFLLIGTSGFPFYKGEQIQNIFSCEQQIVQKSN